MERVAEKYNDKIMSAEQAACFIKTGMTIGMSGFTLVGYPKAVPQALAQSGHARDLTICIGASAGDDLDGALVRSGLIKKRYGYQANKDMRAAINGGKTKYEDMHISHFPLMVNQHVGPEIDVAVVECTALTEEGLIPTASIGCMDAVVHRAKQIIVEVNQTIPIDMMGIHDVFEVGVPPHGKIIPITEPMNRVGQTCIPCEPEKIVAVVLSQRQDQPAKFAPITSTSQKLGENVVSFLKGEVKAGRLPENIGPIQSGVGSVGNAILQALSTSGFRGLTMYTEVMQDAALKLIEMGVLDSVSASAISLEAESREYFYKHMDFFKKHIVLRPQEISNHPEVIRRLGVVAINTPIEVDIYGNVNSTHIAGTQIMNGIGGSGDFTRNARLNIFVTESIAKNGLVSCIVPMVSHVDHTEHDVQVIITEQGIADLRWKTPCERAEILIENCAHPSYRPLLKEYFEHARKVSPGQHTPHDLRTALFWHQKLMETGSMK